MSWDRSSVKAGWLQGEEPDLSEKSAAYQKAYYLMGLSVRVFHIAPIHGVDQGDYEELRSIAADLDVQAVRDFQAREEY